MRVLEKIRRVRTLPPGEVLRRVQGRVVERWRIARSRRRDARLPTYGGVDPRGDRALGTHLRVPAVELIEFRSEAIREHAAMILEHRFDLLGSGPVSADHGAAVRGFSAQVYPGSAPVEPDDEGNWLVARINRANQGEARRWWRLVSPGYRPVDWQRDLRSGYRWNEGLPSVDQGLESFPPCGADVKLPWELARMQHLPILAWAYALSRGGAAGFVDADRYRIEFCDEIADFCALNPPRFGVNWACTMDVAIRVVSWLAAHDLFRGFGATFPRDWLARFTSAVRDHAAHIANHLERAGPVRANHYLADVAGLAFAAAALPRDREVDAWLWFAAHEVRREVTLQFHAGGANFEASTAYHRLSSEMALWTTALLLGLPGDRAALLSSTVPETVLAHMPGPTAGAPAWRDAVPPLPLGEEYWDRIEGMGRFVRACTGPDGLTPLVGDEDGGRFLKVVPRWRPRGGSSGEGARPEARWEEDPADHRHVAELAESLLGVAPPPGTEAAWEAAVLPAMRAGPARAGERYEPPVPGPVSTHPEAGIFVLRSAGDFVTFRCGSVGQRGNGGHAHNDQLSLTVHLSGVAILTDPGTYVYTALPSERNRFRSTAMHNTLQVESLEQCPWSETRAGLFELHDRAGARIESVSAGRLVASHVGFGVRHRREVRLRDDGVHVHDVLEAPRSFRLHFHFAAGIKVVEDPGGRALYVESAGTGARFLLRVDSGPLWVEAGVVSPSYGLLEAAPVGVVESTGTTMTWSLVKVPRP